MVETVGAILLEDGEILLGLRAAHKSFAGCWDVIGGHVEPAETPWTALCRELAEEIGVSAPVGVLHDVLIVGGVPLHLYLVSGWTGVPAIRNEEHDELRWFSPSQAAGLANLVSAAYRRVFIAIETASPAG